MQAPAPPAGPPGPPPPAAGEPWQRVAVLGCGLFAALTDAARPVSAVLDVDDTLRRRQIEDLLADSHWFDRTLPFVGIETDYVSPWSRLVDAPYYLITRSLEPVLGTQTALDVACFVWPPLLLLPLVVLLHGTACKMLGRGMRPVELVLLAIFLMQAAVEFAPRRIDHHNIQMVLLALFVRGLTLSDPLRSGIVAGSAAVLSMAVGLETVPMLVAGAAGLAITGAMGGQAAQRRMAAAGGAMLTLSPVAGLVLVGPVEMGKVQCDALSAPWISAAASGGALLLLAPYIWRRLLAGGGTVLRLASLVGAALLMLAALAIAFPSCSGGPLQMIDPVTKAFWFDNVAQEQSGFSLVTDDGRRAFAILICLVIGAVILSGWDMIQQQSKDNGQRLMVWLIVLAGVAMALIAVRYVRITFLLAALVMPLAVAALAAARYQRGGWQTPAGLSGAGAAAFIAAGLSPYGGSPAELPLSHHHMLAATCSSNGAVTLKQLPPGVLMAPLSLSPMVLESGAGHSLSAIPFHRSAPGIRQMALAFTSPDAGTVRSALSGIDYVAVCGVNAPVPMDDMPLYRDLTHGIARTGFELLTQDGPSQLRVYRITPEQI